MYILHLHYQSQGYANNEIGTKRQINVLSFDDKTLPKDYDDIYFTHTVRVVITFIVYRDDDLNWVVGNEKYELVCMHDGLYVAFVQTDVQFRP